MVKKILTAINERSVILQAMNATLDVEISNLKSLLDDLNLLRESWKVILQESKIVAETLSGVNTDFSTSKKRKRFEFLAKSPEVTFEEYDFKVNVFYVILDSVIAGINTRYSAVNDIHKTFSFLWNFKTIDEENLLLKIVQKNMELLCQKS